MKNTFFLFLIILFYFFSCKNKTETKNTTTPKVNLEELEKQGFAAFQKNPKDAIPIFIEVANRAAVAKDVKKTGLTNLNIANIYDEYVDKKDSALWYANQSLKVWKQADDTLQQANLYKYIGLLQGKLGSIDKAKTNIETAISFYEKKNFMEGKAVAEFNLADVYLQAGDTKKSMNLFYKSTKYWKEKEKMDRVFSNNLFGIELFGKMGAKENIKMLIEENNKLLPTLKLNDFLKNKYDDLLKQYED